MTVPEIVARVVNGTAFGINVALVVRDLGQRQWREAALQSLVVVFLATTQWVLELQRSWFAKRLRPDQRADRAGPGSTETRGGGTRRMAAAATGGPGWRPVLRRAGTAAAIGDELTMSGDTRARLYQGLHESGVPNSLREGLVEYFVARRPTGSFLQACLENDFKGAAVRADDRNRHYLREIALFLINDAPERAWGSRAAVYAWLADPVPVRDVVE